MTNDLLVIPDDALVAAGISTVTLIAEHLALVDLLDRPSAYTLGTLTLGSAFTWWCHRHGQRDAATAWWLIAGLGGVSVQGAYWLRRWLAQRTAEDVENGRRMEGWAGDVT